MFTRGVLWHYAGVVSKTATVVNHHLASIPWTLWSAKFSVGQGLTDSTGRLFYGRRDKFLLGSGPPNETNAAVYY